MSQLDSQALVGLAFVVFLVVCFGIPAIIWSFRSDPSVCTCDDDDTDPDHGDPEPLERQQAVEIAREWALEHGISGDSGTPDYLPRTAREAAEFQPHDWVVDAIVAASEVSS